MINTYNLTATEIAYFGAQMARYIITMDPATYADSAAATSAIVSSGATVEKTFNFALTFEIEATAEQKTAIAGILRSEASSTPIGVSLEVLNIDHLNSTLIDKGNVSGTITIPTLYNPENRGAGQHLYLVDTGIRHTHEQFAGVTINDLYSNFADDPSIDDFNDTTGHGTLVGSVMVGKDLGAAKDATLHNVKLFNSGADNITVAEIVSALNAVLSHHQSNNPSQAKVVCLPWVATRNSYIDEAILDLNAANLVVVCAAGNGGADVANFSPAGLTKVITVGAHDQSWSVGSFVNMPWNGTSPQASFNNYGAAVDIFAMGINVTTATKNADDSYTTTATGTSVASGITAGVAAQYICKYPSYTSDQIKDTMLQEGHLVGLQILTFSNDASINYASVNKSILTFDKVGEDYLTTTPSGRVANVQAGQSATINLGLNGAATDVAALDFAPLPPWAVFNAGTGVISVDTTTVPAENVPGAFVFAIKGKVNNVTKVEEFSIGVYNTSLNDLEGADQYYYDADSGAYDPVVSFQVAPNAQK